MSGWVALGLGTDGWRGFSIKGSNVITEARGPDEAGVLGQLALDGPVVRLGEGAPVCVPAAVLPQAGEGFAGLEQTRPADALGGWPRLWLAGLLGVRPGWDGIAVVTEDDVRHWLQLSAGEVVSMQGVLTPRLQAVLGGSETVDMDAVADTMSRPERLAAHLHAARMAGVSEMVTGHLLGAELAATRAYWLGQQVVVVGGGDALAVALRTQGVPVDEEMTRTLEPAGLAALGRALGYCA